MSRTDKDVPYRIREYRDGHIKHDHRSGECREETRDHANSRAHWFREGRHHYKNCPKNERVEVPCPGRYVCYRAREKYQAVIDSTWTDVYSHRVRNRAVFTKPENFSCGLSHFTTIKHNEIACGFCDRPTSADPTCEYELGNDVRARWWASTAPRWFRNEMERTNRRKVYAELADARRDWNENGDTDVDAQNKFAPHSAAWYYW